MFKELTEGEMYPSTPLFGGWMFDRRGDYACIGIRILLPWKSAKHDYIRRCTTTKHWKLALLFYRQDKEYPQIGFTYWYE